MRTIRYAVILFFLSASLGCGASEDGHPAAPVTEAASQEPDIDDEPATPDESTTPDEPDERAQSNIADEPQEPEGGDTKATEEPGPAIDGLEILLEAGMWWEYAYVDEGRVASQSGASHSVNEGVYRIVVASAESVGGLVAHRLVVVPTSGDTPPNPPPWDYVAVEGSTWLGSRDGGEFSAIYDTVGGVQAGGGFFDRFGKNTLIEVEHGNAAYPDEFSANVGSRYLGSPAIVFRHSEEQSRCVNLGTQGTVCGSESHDERVTEYFLADVGPLGRTYFISGSENGNSFVRSVNIVLVDHGTGGTIPEHIARENDAAPGYTRYADDTGTFAIDIPVSFTAVQTIAQISGDAIVPKIAAALDSSVGDDNWGVLGVVAYYFEGATINHPDRAEWIQILASVFDNECTDFAFVGESEWHDEFQHSGCSSHQAKQRYLAFDVANTADRLLVTFQWIDDADFEHFQPILDSIEVM